MDVMHRLKSRVEVAQANSRGNLLAQLPAALYVYILCRCRQTSQLRDDLFNLIINKFERELTLK